MPRPHLPGVKGRDSGKGRLRLVVFQLNRVNFVILLTPLDDISVVLIALAQMVLFLAIHRSQFVLLRQGLTTGLSRYVTALQSWFLLFSFFSFFADKLNLNINLTKILQSLFQGFQIAVDTNFSSFPMFPDIFSNFFDAFLINL